MEPTDEDIEAIRAAAEAVEHPQGWADCVNDDEWRAAIAEWEKRRALRRER